MILFFGCEIFPHRAQASTILPLHAGISRTSAGTVEHERQWLEHFRLQPEHFI